MLVEIEDFKTGWFGISMGIKKRTIDNLIKALQKMKSEEDHFHLRSTYQGSGGVGDIEFYLLDDNKTGNMEMDSNPAHNPMP